MQLQHGTGNKVLRYQEKRKEEKKIHKNRKQEWEKKQLEKLQDLYCSREVRKFYSKMKGTKKEFKPRAHTCKDKGGLIICDQNEVLTRWNEYFDDLLNKHNSQEHTAAEGENIQRTEGPMVEAKKLNFADRIKKALNKNKKIWNTINIESNKTDCSNTIRALNINGTLTNDGQTMANGFNEHFSSIARNITTKLNKHSSDKSDNKTPTHYLLQSFQNSFKNFTLKILLYSLGMEGYM